jgi:hypothetical protein
MVIGSAGDLDSYKMNQYFSILQNRNRAALLSKKFSSYNVNYFVQKEAAYGFGNAIDPLLVSSNPYGRYFLRTKLNTLTR